MGKVAFATIHGMGQTPPEYADKLWAAVRARLDPARAAVEFDRIYYKLILQDNEQAVWSAVRDNATTVRYDSLRQFFLFGFGDAAGLENRKEDDGSVYEQAQLQIARTLLGLRDRCGGSVPLVLMAHSLGCQVLSSYLYDAQKAEHGPVRVGIWQDIQRHAYAIAGRALLAPEEIDFLRGATCTALLTTGCNIPIFVAAHQKMTILPIRKPTPGFHWLNLYDPDDALGWPLGPLSEGYQALVEDRAINAGGGLVDWMLKGWNPWSHTAYWDGDNVRMPLLDMLHRAGAAGAAAPAAAADPVPADSV
jgi:hypothetical protein